MKYSRGILIFFTGDLLINKLTSFPSTFQSLLRLSATYSKASQEPISFKHKLKKLVTSPKVAELQAVTSL